MREEGESIFLTVCEKVKENRNGWLVRADTIPRRRGRSLETWRNNVSLEERLTRSRWTEHRGSQSFRDRFLIHLPRSFINILQLGWILCTCVSELSLSLLIRLGQMNPRNFVLFDRCERPALSPLPPQLKALTPATSNLLKFIIRRARLPHTRLCVINFILPFLSPPRVFPTNDYILLLLLLVGSIRKRELER